MHPLSTFPQLFFLGLVAPFLLRITVGVFIIYLGKERYHKNVQWLSVIHVISGICLFMGLYTQISAIVGIVLIAFEFYLENTEKKVSTEKKILYIVSAIILLSLLFTGAGFMAFDRPL